MFSHDTIFFAQMRYIRENHSVMSRTMVVLACILTACNPSDSLVEKIEDEWQSQEGIFAMAFKDLTSGETVLINERVVFHAASTMKTPVMVEVFNQAEQGLFSLEDSILVRNEFKSIVDSSLFSLSPDDDSEQDLYTQVGKKKPLSSLVYKMIISSSNLATNIIIDLVKATKVTASMREMGAHDIQIRRGVEDTKAFEKGLNNTTTAYDLMLIFEKIARREMVSPAASDAMIDILLDQHFNDIIPAKLPGDVKVAHKTGSITGVQHDSGIVILPDGRKYVVVLLSKDLKDTEAAVNSMAIVSRMLYDHVQQVSSPSGE